MQMEVLALLVDLVLEQLALAVASKLDFQCPMAQLRDCLFYLLASEQRAVEPDLVWAERSQQSSTASTRLAVVGRRVSLPTREQAWLTIPRPLRACSGLLWQAGELAN